MALLNRSAVLWSSKRQTTVAQSLYEIKYIAASKAIKEAVWIGCFLKELHQVYNYPISLYCDNQGSIALVKNLENHQQTKHIDVRYHYIREKEEDETISIVYTSTKNMIADGLTKLLSPARLRNFVELMGLQRD